MNIDFWKENIKRFNVNVKKTYGIYSTPPHFMLKFWMSELYCAIRFGCSFDDFFRYEFYKKSDYERNKFITYRRSKKIIHKYNDSNYIGVMNNKVKFNEVFGKYIHRDFLDLRTASYDMFYEFLVKHGQILMKPMQGGQGKGIFKITIDDYKSKAFDLDKYRGYIAEEILVQHHDLKKLNPSSVNTVRVLTFCGEIIACALRIGGSDSIVDKSSFRWDLRTSG